MPRKLDIFTKQGTAWICYKQAVPSDDVEPIVCNLERNGLHVATFTVGRTIGRLVYETPND